MSTKFLNTKDVREMFGISRQTLYNWTKGGLLRAYTISGKIFFKIEDINNSLKDINEYRRLRHKYEDYVGTDMIPYSKLKKLKKSLNK